MRPSFFALAILAGAALSACNQARISGSGMLSSGSSGVYTVTVDTFQSQPRASWSTDSSGNAYTNKDLVTISGSCTRGVQYVQVSSSGSPLGTNASCDVNGAYTYSYTFSSDGTYPLVFQPLDLNGAALGSAVAQGIVIQTLPPAAPVITTNGGAGFSSSTSLLTLNGTISTDTVRVTASASGSVSGVNLSFGSGVFQYSATLPPGSSTTFTFYAYDLAGNASSPDQISVSYSLSTLLALSVFSSASSGASMTGAAGNHLLDVTITPFISTTQPLSSAPNAYRLYTGIASVRASSP